MRMSSVLTETWTRLAGIRDRRFTGELWSAAQLAAALCSTSLLVPDAATSPRGSKLPESRSASKLARSKAAQNVSEPLFSPQTWTHLQIRFGVQHGLVLHQEFSAMRGALHSRDGPSDVERNSFSCCKDSSQCNTRDYCAPSDAEGL
jgi:hypothetical protein